MKIELSAEQNKYKNEFRSFVDEVIVPNASKFDEEEKISDEVIKKVALKGYLGSMIPKEYGGMNLDMVTIGVLNEEIGRGCSSVRGLLTVHGMVALAILKWGTEEQKKYWLPKMAIGEIIGAFGLTEPETGSDAKSIQTQARVCEEGYVLDGTKKWITMGQIADMFLIFAKCEDKPMAFLVEKSSNGVGINPIKNILGARASMLSEIYLDNCIIPKENIIGTIGTGLSHVALSSLDYGRYTIACGCVGIGQACLEKSLKYIRERKQFGDVLGKHQLIQKMITNMVVNIKAARLMCYSAGYLKDICDPDSIMETWNAKYFASTMLSQITSDAVQIHGANGVSKEYEVERYFRDAKINEIIEGSTQVHEILIANNAFKFF